MARREQSRSSRRSFLATATGALSLGLVAWDRDGSSSPFGLAMEHQMTTRTVSAATTGAALRPFHKKFPEEALTDLRHRGTRVWRWAPGTSTAFDQRSARDAPTSLSGHVQHGHELL